MSTNTKGMVSTRARGKTNVSTTSSTETRMPFSSAGMSLQGGPREAVASDAPEVNRHEETRDERNEDAVQDVEAEQRVRPDLPAAEEEGTRVVDRVQAGDELVTR